MPTPAADLLPCAFLERATAHVILGWLPKVSNVEVKLALGRQQLTTMTRALELEKLLTTGGKLSGRPNLSIPARWRDRMAAIDASRDETELLGRLYLGVKGTLLTMYRRLLAGLDRVLDATLVALVTAAIEENTAQVRWAEGVLGRDGQASARPLALGPLGSAAMRVGRKAWLWRPLGRVPSAARPPEGSRADVAGAIAIPLVKPGLRAVAAMLHENIDAEITTMELFARSSYEHPELPEAFHRDMSRQTSDESRHAQACLSLAGRYGLPYGALPMSTYVYDFHYAFGPCKPGSRRELLWRLLLRSTFQEALSLDGFATLSARLTHDRAPDAARMMESIMADEVFHVEAGLKWSRFLCGGDDDRVFRERERAHRYYVDAHRRARKAFVQAHPDDAIAEAKRFTRVRRQARVRYPFDLRIFLARDARRAIGFSERDLGQVVGWGYALPRA